MQAMNIPLAPEPFGPIATPCDKCDAKCCKFYTVTITAFDLARLVEFRKREFCHRQNGVLLRHEAQSASLDFVTYKPASEVRSTMDHPFFLRKDGRLGEYFMCLKRDPEETCVLYSGGHLCSVHPARPLVCRIYPFRETETGAIGYKKKHRCPVEWKKSAKLVEEVKKKLAKQARELSEYGKICREWNAKFFHKSSFSDFVDFCYQKVKGVGETQ